MKIHPIGWNTIWQPRDKGGLGLRKARDVNKSLLAKLHWRLSMEKDKTWVHLIQANYKSKFPLATNTEHNQTSPYIWKGLCWSADLIQKGTGKLVRNGRSTKFWLDVWLEDTKLQDVATQPLHHHMLSHLVSDYWHEET